MESWVKIQDANLSTLKNTFPERLRSARLIQSSQQYHQKYSSAAALAAAAGCRVGGARHFPVSVPHVPEVLPVQGAAGGARPGARRAARDPGASL